MRNAPLTKEVGPLAVAVLGCGRIVRLFHLPILARMEDIAVTLVADSDPACRAAAGELAPDAHVVSDWRIAIEDPAVEAIVIGLPSGLHAETACAAFTAGKHVYLEKPIATNHRDGARVVSAWRASGTVGMTGFQARFDPPVHALRRAIEAGRIGKVLGARVAIGGAARNLPAWKRSRASGGGVLLDLGSHAVDLARFLFDREVASVVAQVASVRTEDDTAALALALVDGTIVQAFLSLAGVQESAIEIIGDRGSLIAERYARVIEQRPFRPAYGRRQILRREIARLATGVRRVAAPPDGALQYRGALTSFARAARRGGKSPSPDIEDGWRSLVVVLAAETAAGTGLRVEMEPAPA